MGLGGRIQKGRDFELGDARSLLADLGDGD